MAFQNSSILSMDYGLCRFCNDTKQCRVVNQEYEHLGQKEVYSDMMLDTFGLLLANMDTDVCSDRLVCARCVVRLRAACAFKQQVQRCEEKLLARLDDLEPLKFMVKTEDGHSMTMDTDSLMDESQVYGSQVDESQLDKSQVGESQLDETESFYDIEVLEESILGSEDEEEDAKDKTDQESDESVSEQDLDIKIELLNPDDIDSSPEGSPEAAPSERSKRKNTAQSEDERSIDTRKSVLAYKNEPTKEVMMERMRKLKALMANRKAAPPLKLTRPIHIPKRPEAKTKELHMQENTVIVVENSYVCPFNNINGNYYCYYCRTMFTNPDLLREHTMTHNPKPYFLRNWSMRRAPKLDITRIDCRLCDEKIETIPDLKAHLSSAHKKRFHNVSNEFLIFRLTYPEVVCLECGGKFFFIDKLIDHMAEHFGRYICEQCGAAFVQYGSLQAHVRCHNKTGVRFPCDVCGKTLSTNRSRKVHIAVVHEKKCVIDCPSCDERFFTYEQRNRHMEEAHGYVRKIPCTECDRVFDNRKNFLNHLATKHSSKDEHEYQCQLCEKTFPVLSYMKKHIKTHHGAKNK